MIGHPFLPIQGGTRKFNHQAVLNQGDNCNNGLFIKSGKGWERWERWER